MTESIIEMTIDQYLKMIAVIEAVKSMPFGESRALPWCRESFPALDEAMKALEIE